MIVNDHVRLLDAFLRPQRDQAKITRAGTDQINLPSLAFASALALIHARNRDLPSIDLSQQLRSQTLTFVTRTFNFACAWRV